MVGAAAATTRIVAVDAGVHAKRQHRYLANSEGARQAQHMMESGGGVVALAAADGRVQRRSYPNSFHGGTAGAGYEYVTALGLVAQAAARRRGGSRAAPRAGGLPGVADLVVGPAQLSLQIHESVGHALELDRILGDERNFAGTSFVSVADAGRLRYGSPAVTITADPTVPGTRGSFAFDDEGTPARRCDLVGEGVLRELPLQPRRRAARRAAHERRGARRRLERGPGVLCHQRLPAAG